jgi:hypothetical protein
MEIEFQESQGPRYLQILTDYEKQQCAEQLYTYRVGVPVPDYVSEWTGKQKR